MRRDVEVRDCHVMSSKNMLVDGLHTLIPIKVSLDYIC